MNYIYRQSRQIPRLYSMVLILFFALMLLLNISRPYYMLLGGLNNPADKGEWVAYTIRTTYASKYQLMLYDTDRASSVAVHVDDYRISFSFSKNGYLAFSASPNETGQISILDTRAVGFSPIILKVYPEVTGYPLQWSPDGRYLAFLSYLDKNHPLIYVWDGKTVANITPNDLSDIAQLYNVSWSSDDRLAFTVRFAKAQSQGDESEIYLWDRQGTHNLSQNPTGRDEGPTWSEDGRIAFLSVRAGKYGIYVWDGISIKSGSPDVDTFTQIAPQSTDFSSYPVWTNMGLIAFQFTLNTNTNNQIYLWDGQKPINISQTSYDVNTDETWSADGRWAFVTYFSNPSIYVRDASNRPLLTIEGKSSRPAWASNGDLMLCTEGTSGWTLSRWDGKQITKIVQGAEIVAQWQGGSNVVCSSG